MKQSNESPDGVVVAGVVSVVVVSVVVVVVADRIVSKTWPNPLVMGMDVIVSSIDSFFT